MIFFFFSGYGDPRDLHLLTHAFPTRRSPALTTSATSAARAQMLARSSTNPAAAIAIDDKIGFRTVANTPQVTRVVVSAWSTPMRQQSPIVTCAAPPSPIPADASISPHVNHAALSKRAHGSIPPSPARGSSNP